MYPHCCFSSTWLVTGYNIIQTMSLLDVDCWLSHTTWICWLAYIIVAKANLSIKENFSFQCISPYLCLLNPITPKEGQFYLNWASCACITTIPIICTNFCLLAWNKNRYILYWISFKAIQLMQLLWDCQEIQAPLKATIWRLHFVHEKIWI